MTLHCLDKVLKPAVTNPLHNLQQKSNRRVMAPVFALF